MTNKVIRGASDKCDNCVAEKSRVLKKNLIKKLFGTRLILNFSCTKHRSL